MVNIGQQTFPQAFSVPIIHGTWNSSQGLPLVRRRIAHGTAGIADGRRRTVSDTPNPGHRKHRDNSSSFREQPLPQDLTGDTDCKRPGLVHRPAGGDGNQNSQGHTRLRMSGDCGQRGLCRHWFGTSGGWVAPVF